MCNLFISQINKQQNVIVQQKHAITTNKQNLTSFWQKWKSKIFSQEQRRRHQEKERKKKRKKAVKNTSKRNIVKKVVVKKNKVIKKHE